MGRHRQWPLYFLRQLTPLTTEPRPEPSKRKFSLTNGITYLDEGTLSFMLASYIEEADNRVIIDTAQFHGAAGHIGIRRRRHGPFVTGNLNKSVHEVNITDILALAQRARL
ncbi:MAG: hypothetical protein ACXV7J_15635 [Methylomonas sp.]